MSDPIQFTAILKQVSAKSLASLDKFYRVILETEDVAALGAGAWPADETVSVHIERNPK